MRVQFFFVFRRCWLDSLVSVVFRHGFEVLDVDSPWMFSCRCLAVQWLLSYLVSILVSRREVRISSGLAVCYGRDFDSVRPMLRRHRRSALKRTAGIFPIELDRTDARSGSDRIVVSFAIRSIMRFKAGQTLPAARMGGGIG